MFLAVKSLLLSDKHLYKIASHCSCYHVMLFFTGYYCSSNQAFMLRLPHDSSVGQAFNAGLAAGAQDRAQAPPTSSANQTTPSSSAPTTSANQGAGGASPFTMPPFTMPGLLINGLFLYRTHFP